MAHGERLDGHVEEGCRTTHFSTLCISCQASAEHFQQCAEFLPLRNRGLGPLAVTVLPHSARQEDRRYRLRRRAIDSGLFSSLATDRVSRSWSGCQPFQSVAIPDQRCTTQRYLAVWRASRCTASGTRNNEAVNAPMACRNVG
jgi:hypothetical protein